MKVVEKGSTEVVAEIKTVVIRALTQLRVIMFLLLITMGCISLSAKDIIVDTTVARVCVILWIVGGYFCLPGT